MTEQETKRRGRAKEFFLYKLGTDIIRVNILPTDISKVREECKREECMNTGVYADANSFVKYLISKGYKAKSMTLKEDMIIL